MLFRSRRSRGTDRRDRQVRYPRARRPPRHDEVLRVDVTVARVTQGFARRARAIRRRRESSTALREPMQDLESIPNIDEPRRERAHPQTKNVGRSRIGDHLVIGEFS